MAMVSVKFQRITAYISVLICLVLFYQIYNYGRFRGKIKNTERQFDFRNSFLVTRDVNSNEDEAEITESTSVNSSILRLRKDRLREELTELKAELLEAQFIIRRLENELTKMTKKEKILVTQLTQMKTHNEEILDELEACNRSSQNSAKQSERSKIERDENTAVRKPQIRISESVPFTSFAKTHVFEANILPKPKEYMYRGQRKETRIIKSDRKHLFEMETLAINAVNKNESFQLTREHILEGYFRFDINFGVDYEFYFSHPRIANSVIPVKLSRGVTKPVIEIISSPQRTRQLDKLINIILPLAGRLERFENFVDRFIEICVKKDKNVYLTVVLYGEKDFNAVKNVLRNLESEHDFRRYQLVMRDKAFSRGRALHDGVVYWKGKETNVLMFFCDVDVTFRAEFLRRCRTYTEPGKQVYYPMVFSLYNPKNVYQDGNVPEPEDQLRIERSHGFWRTYGFGMTCQYRSDYLSVGGFDLSIEGWGSEDQRLYARYTARPKIRIIRAPDRDLFHHYHEKFCDPNLKWEQYRSCLGSKAKTEGTPAQIAMQYTKLREKYEGFGKHE